LKDEISWEKQKMNIIKKNAPKRVQQCFEIFNFYFLRHFSASGRSNFWRVRHFSASGLSNFWQFFGGLVFGNFFSFLS
jgi:hypothetical protein